MLTQRSQEVEWMDLGLEYFTQDEYQHCLQQLFKVNKLLGIFTDTIKQLRFLSPTISVLDIGCGGGFFLLALHKRFPHMSLKGIDICPSAIAVANQALSAHPTIPAQAVSFQLQRHKSLDEVTQPIDVILATLVCHHMSDEELIQFLLQASQMAKKIIINDLQRSFLAQGFYAVLSPLLFRNRLITHDGLISIRRGFKRKELYRLLQAASIRHYQIKWRFPFRWQIIISKEVV